MEWTDAQTKELRELWASGMSGGDIGARLHITKNAVIGKAHRIHLAERPSPISLRGPNYKAVRAKPPPLTSETPHAEPLPIDPEEAMHPEPPPAEPETDALHVEPEEAPLDVRPWTPTMFDRPHSHAITGFHLRTAAPRALPLPTLTPRTGRVIACQWPIGEVGRPDFRMCDVPSAPGRPYCEDHVKVAYVRVRTMRDDAA
jgi:GcrA cell cycle regulator